MCICMKDDPRWRNDSFFVFYICKQHVAGTHNARKVDEYMNGLGFRV